LTVLAENHGQADHPLGMVVLERHLRMIQERKQAVTVAPQPLG